MEANDPENQTSYLRFLDIGNVWLVAAWCLGYYYDWIGTDNSLGETWIAASLNGVWRSVPFFDSDELGAQVEKSGLPVMDRNHVSIPEPHGRSLWLGKTFDLRWLMFCNVIGFALGLPYEISEDIIFKAVQNAAQSSAQKQ